MTGWELALWKVTFLLVDFEDEQSQKTTPWWGQTCWMSSRLMGEEGAGSCVHLQDTGRRAAPSSSKPQLHLCPVGSSENGKWRTFLFFNWNNSWASLFPADRLVSADPHWRRELWKRMVVIRQRLRLTYKQDRFTSRLFCKHLLDSFRSINWFHRRATWLSSTALSFTNGLKLNLQIKNHTQLVSKSSALSTKIQFIYRLNNCLQ